MLGVWGVAMGGRKAPSPSRMLRSFARQRACAHVPTTIRAMSLSAMLASSLVCSGDRASYAALRVGSRRRYVICDIAPLDCFAARCCRSSASVGEVMPSRDKMPFIACRARMLLSYPPHARKEYAI